MPQRAAVVEPDVSGIPDASAPPQSPSQSRTASSFEPDLTDIPDAPKQTLGRVASTFTQKGIVEPLSGLASIAGGLFTDPVQTVKDVGYGLVEPTLTHGAAALRAVREGRVGDAFDQAGRAVPIVGPMIGSVVDTALAGDYAGAGGEAAADLLPFAAGRLARRVRPVKDTGTRIPLTRAERTGSGSSRFIEQVTERTVPGAGVFERFRAAQQAALQREAHTLASLIDRGARTGADVGTLIQTAIVRGREALRVRGQQLYAQLDDATRHTNVTTRVPETRTVPSAVINPVTGQPFEITQTTMRSATQRVGGAQPTTDSLRQFAARELQRLTEESTLVPPTELARTRGILQTIVDAPERVTFRAMQDARSDMLKIARSHGDPVPGKAGGIARQLAGRMDDAMTEAAEQLGGPRLVQQLREANATWEQLKTVYNSRFMRRLADASPEVVTKYVRLADVDDLAMLSDALPPRVYDTVRGRIMRDLVAGATDPPAAAVPGGILRQGQDAMGVTLHGRPVTDTSRLSGTKIRAQLHTLGDAKVDMLFGARAAESLQDIARLADRVSPQAAKYLPGLIAGGVNATIFAPLLNLIPGVGVGSMATSAATALAMNATAQLLTRPQGLVAYRALLRGLNNGNVKMAGLAGLALTRQLAAQNDLTYPGVDEEAAAALANPVGNDPFAPDGAAVPAGGATAATTATATATDMNAP